MKAKVLIECRKEKLRVLFVRGRLVKSFEEIPLREMPREALLDRLRQIRGNAGRAACVLLLPRSSVIERKFNFGPEGRLGPEIWLKNNIREMLPLSLDELGYGAAVRKERSGYHGTLLAIPLAGLKEIFGILDDAGLSPDDIFSTDQALRWLAPPRNHPVRLILALAEGEGEALLATREETLGYKFLRGEPSEIIEDLNYFLLESGVKPGSVLVCGSRNSALDASLGAVFAGLKRVDLPGDIPPALFGTAVLDPGSMISLLPRERKMKKREGERKNLAREAGFLSVLLFCLCLAGIFLHGARVDREKSRAAREFAKMRPRLEEIRKRASLLEAARRQAGSNAALLRFLKNLSREAPDKVFLNELAWEEDGLRLRGMSPSYAGVTGTIEVLAGFDFLVTPRLEYARLRKKESLDFFDFGITAGRKEFSPGRARAPFESSPAGETREDGDWVRRLVILLESRGLKVDALTPDDSSGVTVRAKGRVEDWVWALHQLTAEARVYVERLRIFPESAPAALVFEIRAAEIKKPPVT